jgi:hypothetical protein
MQRQLAAEAEKHGMTVPQYIEQLKAQHSGETAAANGPAAAATTATAAANSTWPSKSCCAGGCEFLEVAGNEATDSHIGREAKRDVQRYVYV